VVKEGCHGRSPLGFKPTDPLHAFGSTLNQRVSRWLGTQKLRVGVNQSPEQVQGELSRRRAGSDCPLQDTACARPSIARTPSSQSQRRTAARKAGVPDLAAAG
jgi:hypothetical protein